MKRFWDTLFISHGKCYGRSNILPQSGRDSLIVFILFIYLVCAHESLQDAFGSDNEANFQASLKFSWRAKDYIWDITRWREDMNFIFEWQNSILRTSAASE